MPVTLELPAEMEQRLRADDPEFDRGMRTAMALELFRKEKITLFELRTMLGMTRTEVNLFLKERDEWAQSPTMHDLEEDYQTLQAVLRKHGK